MPGTSLRSCPGTSSSARDRPDRGDDQVARHDVGDPAGGRGTRVLADAAEGDDHGQPDGQAAERQCSPAPVAHDRVARQPCLEPKEQAERRPGHPGDDGQDERDEQRPDEKDGVDGERLDDAGVARRPRQDDQPDGGDHHEDDGQPAQTRRPRTGQVESRPERLDRLDPARPTRRLECGREGDADADEEGDGDRVEPECRAVEGDRSDGPHEGDHADRQKTAEDEADQRSDDPDDEGLGEDERHDLAATSTGRAEQPDLADPFVDGHRQRVEDQERTGEQRHGRDERGRRLEVGRRRTEGGGEVLW